GLDDRFRLLTGGARTATARQRTLLASVEWSHDLLDEEERILFRRLAVFTTPFSLEAAEAVAADDELDRLGVFDGLAHLVDKSLVQHLGDGYRLLETLRQYALERADDAGELAELRDRHLAWFRRRASGWRLEREWATDAVLGEVAAEGPDLIAALDWSLGCGQGVALELLQPLAEHLALRDALGELSMVARRVLGALPEGSPGWLEALAPFANCLVVARDLGWQPAARRALDAFGSDVDVVTRGFVEYAFGLSAVFAGRPEGISALRDAVEAGRSSGNRRLELISTVNLAYFLTMFGDVASARPLLAWLDRQAAESTVSFLHDAASAKAAMHRGDFTGARRRLDQALARNALLGLLVQAGEIGFLSRDWSAVRGALAGLKARPTGWALTAPVVALLEGMLLLLSDELEAAARALDGTDQDVAFFAERWSAVLRAEIDFSLGDLAGAAKRVSEIEGHLAGTDLPAYRAGVDLLAA
ncbi:MAG: hypothetical protein ACREI8_10285, partial [Myxococcota bacterium]